MRKIYIIRHCRTMESSEGKCIGRFDLPLGAVGREQAEILSGWAADHGITNIYSSPLRRCLETADFAVGGSRVNVIQELAEVSVGEWEGLSFSEIRRRWPAEYEERGLHIGTVAPPGGESFADAGERLDKAVRGILSETEGDILIVAHAGILRGWLCKIAEISPDRVFEYNIPYGSITCAGVDGAKFHIDHVGKRAAEIPGRKEVQFFYKECNTPLKVQEHCRAVAEKALALSDRRKVDRRLLYVSGLLHDMCRTDGREHPRSAAVRLRKAGYGKMAGVVECHHDLQEAAEPSVEAELLYLADKLVQGTTPVTIEARFEASKAKCVNDEAAKSAWRKRYDAAIRLAEKYS